MTTIPLLRSTALSRTPTEILTEIFTLACTRDTEELDNGYPKRTTNLVYAEGRTALRLSLVCRRWRKIAENFPKLWSTINVTVHNHSVHAPWAPTCFSRSPSVSEKARAHPLGGIVKLYLERSGTRPLDITVACRMPWPISLGGFSPTHDFCGALLSCVFEILWEESKRWRTANILLPHGPRPLPSRMRRVAPGSHDEGVTDVGFERVELEAPLLETLDIELEPGPYTLAFSTAPRLRMLAVNSASTWGRPPFDETKLFNAPPLRLLTFRNYSVFDLWRVLAKLGDRDGSSPVSGSQHVLFVDFHHSDLRGLVEPPVYEVRGISGLSVYINHSSPSSFVYLCGSFRAPSVTELEFRFRLFKKDEFESDNWVRRYCFFQYEAVGAMIRRSEGMRLRVLIIDGFYFGDDPQALVDFLRIVPTVEVLTVGEGRVEFEESQYREVYLGGDSNREHELKAKDKDVGREVSENAPVGPHGILSRLLRRLDVSSSLSIVEEAPVLPGLTNLSLTFRPTCAAGDLLQMAYSRSTGYLRRNFGAGRNVASLESVEVTLIMDTEALSSSVEDFRDGLRELKKGGLDVRFSVIIY